MTVPVEVPRINFKIVGSTLRVISGLVGGMAVPLSGDMGGVIFDNFTVVCMFVLFILIITSEYVAPVIDLIDVRAGATICALVGTVIGLALDIGFDMVADVDANICDASITTLEMKPRLTLSKEPLLFSGGARNCSSTSTLNCRALQT